MYCVGGCYACAWWVGTGVVRGVCGLLVWAGRDVCAMRHLLGFGGKTDRLVHSTLSLLMVLLEW